MKIEILEEGTDDLFAEFEIDDEMVDKLKEQFNITTQEDLENLVKSLILDALHNLEEEFENNEVK